MVVVRTIMAYIFCYRINFRNVQVQTKINPNLLIFFNCMTKEKCSNKASKTMQKGLRSISNKGVWSIAIRNKFSSHMHNSFFISHATNCDKIMNFPKKRWWNARMRFLAKWSSIRKDQNGYFIFH